MSVACDVSAGSLFPPAPPWTCVFAAKFTDTNPSQERGDVRDGGGSHSSPARSMRGGGAERGRRVWGGRVVGRRVTRSFCRAGGRVGLCCNLSGRGPSARVPA